MIMQPFNQISSGPRWGVLLAIFCILFALLIVSGTIILALIPVYLTTSDINTSANQNGISFYAIYAADLTNGRSLTLSNMNDVAAQMMKTTPRLNNLKYQSGRFLPATASSKKKRQISTLTCQQSTGLMGDLFTVQPSLQPLSTCHSSNCRSQLLQKTQDSMRTNQRAMTITMKFTNGEIHNVRLALCFFSTTDPANQISSPTTSSKCTAETSTYIYLLDQDANLFQFHPLTYVATFIGALNCSTIAYPYSMAVQSSGKAWTLFTDGSLYTFDVTTAQCQLTPYLSEQEGLVLFGMDFVQDGPNDNETLYISSDSMNLPYRLATIDTDTLEISIVAYYNAISARAELAGTNDGRLFGLFEGTPFIIAEINRTNADILSKTSQDMIQYISDSSYFAFIFYSSNFFLFVGNYNSTDIFLYNPSTKLTTKQQTISNGIVGAGVSTCIQT